MRVLFVGNSYTHVENLPNIASAFAEDRGLDLVIRKSTVGGVTLEEHWKGEKGLRTRQLIETGDFDVVLQEQSTRPVTEPEETVRYAKLLCELIK